MRGFVWCWYVVSVQLRCFGQVEQKCLGAPGWKFPPPPAFLTRPFTIPSTHKFQYWSNIDDSFCLDPRTLNRIFLSIGRYHPRIHWPHSQRTPIQVFPPWEELLLRLAQYVSDRTYSDRGGVFTRRHWQNCLVTRHASENVKGESVKRWMRSSPCPDTVNNVPQENRQTRWKCLLQPLFSR